MIPDPSPEALDRFSRRLLAIAAVLGLLLIAVVVNRWLHDGDEAIDPFNPIAAAASQTESASGYTATMEVIYVAAGQGPPVTASGTVEYNASTDRSRADLSVPTPAGTTEVESINIAGHAYLRSDAFAGQIPAGAEWIGIESSHLQSSPGFAGSEGAKSQLRMLRGVSDVEEVGREAIDGTETRHYRGTVYDQAPDPIPVEAWITPGGTLMQLRVVSALPSDDGRPQVTMNMLITIDELGVAPDIDLPDPGSVYDATSQLSQQLQGLS